MSAFEDSNEQWYWDFVLEREWGTSLQYLLVSAEYSIGHVVHGKEVTVIQRTTSTSKKCLKHNRYSHTSGDRLCFKHFWEVLVHHRGLTY